MFSTIRFHLTLWLAKLAAWAVGLISKKRGTNLSGDLAIRLMPDFVTHFRGINHERVIFITGTNGKSTTTNLLRHVLETNGKKVVCNVEGANMLPGIATALVKAADGHGYIEADYLVLEVDERSFPAIHRVLPARRMGVTNLEKDQVMRNGDPDFIFRKLRQAIPKDMVLYLNNEEPRSKALEDAGTPQLFSVAENARTFRREGFFHVTEACAKCGHPIVFEKYNLASMGPFRCSRCGHRSELLPEAQLTDIDLIAGAFRCGSTTFQVTYTEPFYLYNYAMVIAICRSLGLTDGQIRQGFSSFRNPAVHISEYYFHGKEVHRLVAKQENPEALQTQLEEIARDKRPKAVFVGMRVVADYLPYYASSFYFFDNDFGPVIDSNVERYVAFSETVCYDLASRMIYAGAPEDRVTVLDTDDFGPVMAEMDKLDVPVAYFVMNLKSYNRIGDYLEKHGGIEHG